MNARLTYRDCRAIRARARARVRRQRVTLAVVILAIVALAAGIKPAAGATDVPPRRPVVTRVCGHWARGISGSAPVCARWYRVTR